MDTGRILALDVSEKDGEIQEALDEVRTVVTYLISVKLIGGPTRHGSFPLSKASRPIPVLASGPKMHRPLSDRFTYN